MLPAFFARVPGEVCGLLPRSGGLGSARAAGHRGSAAAEPPGSELAWKQAAPVCCGLTCMPFGTGLRSPCRGWGSRCAPWGPPPEPCLEAAASPGQDSAGAHAPQLRVNPTLPWQGAHRNVSQLCGDTPGGAPFVPPVSPEHRHSAGPGWPLLSAPATFRMQTETENVAGPSGTPLGSQP